MGNLNEMTRELIDETLRQLEDHGWCQGQVMDDYGQLCMLGARNEAFEKKIYYKRWDRIDPKAFIVERAISRRFTELFTKVTEIEHIPSYNDDRSTTYEDVVLTLKQMRELANDDG